MAVEAKRGCGYRKIGGTYLVGGGIGVPCDRLPLALDVCPCCGQGIKQALGFTWVDVAKLQEAQELQERGITAVFVPDNDRDHQGRVYDKQEEPEND